MEQMASVFALKAHFMMLRPKLARLVRQVVRPALRQPSATRVQLGLHSVIPSVFNVLQTSTPKVMFATIADSSAASAILARISA